MKNSLQLFFAEAEADIRRRRLVRFFVNLYHQLWDKNALREVVRYGMRWQLKYHGPDQSVIKKARYEWHLVRYLLTQAHARGCEVFLDVGANFGYYSMLAAKARIFQEIHAIEPVPENFLRLGWHINANNFSDTITAHHIAVSDRCGVLRMLDRESLHPGTSHVLRGDEVADNIAEVQSATLDSLFDFCGRKLAIKMDVEGHEVTALRGAERLLSQNDVFLQVEVWNDNTDSIEYLLARGFKLVYFSAYDFYFERQRT